MIAQGSATSLIVELRQKFSKIIFKFRTDIAFPKKQPKLLKRPDFFSPLLVSAKVIFDPSLFNLTLRPNV